MTQTPSVSADEADTVAAIEAACVDAERHHREWVEALARRNRGIRQLAEQGKSAGQISRSLNGCLSKSGVRFVLRSAD